MRIGLHDSEGSTGFPNLALMKISANHKQRTEDIVEWWNPLETGKYALIYSSKVFSFTAENPYLPHATIRGGTGYKNPTMLELPDKVENLCPDYSLYDMDYSLGKLTTGCIRRCSWCVVPQKEGHLKPHHDIEVFCRHKKVVLMDNNFLAADDWTIKQIAKMSKMGIKVDFNQGLDARLIDNLMARELAKLKWIRFIRLACDSQEMKPYLEKAVFHLNEAGIKPYRVFVYILVKDIKESLDRVKFVTDLGCDPFAQPYRDREGTPPTKDQKRVARWVNNKAVFKSTKFENYKR